MRSGRTSSDRRCLRPTWPNSSAGTEDVARAPGLLRLRQREGHERVYPLFQFTAGGQVPGVAEVVTILSPAFVALTIASWLTSHHRQLDGARPIDVLRAGGTGRVLPLVRQLAADAAA
jgi:hypothetical protein